jgi:hypothetical protein
MILGLYDSTIPRSYSGNAMYYCPLVVERRRDRQTDGELPLRQTERERE